MFTAKVPASSCTSTVSSRGVLETSSIFFLMNSFSVAFWKYLDLAILSTKRRIFRLVLFPLTWLKRGEPWLSSGVRPRATWGFGISQPGVLPVGQESPGKGYHDVLRCCDVLGRPCAPSWGAVPKLPCWCSTVSPPASPHSTDPNSPLPLCARWGDPLPQGSHGLCSGDVFLVGGASAGRLCIAVCQ